MKIKVKDIRDLVRSTLNEMDGSAMGMGMEPEQVSPVASLAEKLGGQVVRTGTSGKTGTISCDLDGVPTEITVVIR